MADAAVLTGPPDGPTHHLRRAFATGLRAHGLRVREVGDPGGIGAEEIVGLWGVRHRGVISRCRAEGRRVVVLERGYLGCRERWVSVSVGGGLNRHGRFPAGRDAGARFDRVARLAPWRAVGRIALILGQCPGDQSLTGIDPVTAWRRLAEMARRAGFEPQFRAHPLMPLRMDGMANRAAGEPLADALSAAGIAMTINSNAAVDAVIAGVPAVVLDDRSMAWPVTGREAPPPTPAREDWAAALAWCQWEAAELADGSAWDAVREVG